MGWREYYFIFLSKAIVILETASGRDVLKWLHDDLSAVHYISLKSQSRFSCMFSNLISWFGECLEWLEWVHCNQPSFCFRGLCYDVGARFGEACFVSWTPWTDASMPWCCSSLCTPTGTIWTPNWWIPVYTGSYLPVMQANFILSSNMRIKNLFHVLLTCLYRERLPTCILRCSLPGKRSLIWEYSIFFNFICMTLVWMLL